MAAAEQVLVYFGFSRVLKVCVNSDWSWYSSHAWPICFTVQRHIRRSVLSKWPRNWIL